MHHTVRPARSALSPRRSRRTSQNILREVRRCFFYNFILPPELGILGPQARQLHLFRRDGLTAGTANLPALAALIQLRRSGGSCRAPVPSLLWIRQP